jgi:glucose/arabinose dehydrogenase
MGMRRIRNGGATLRLVALLAVALAGIVGGTTRGMAQDDGFDPANFSLGFEPVASDFDRPLFYADPNDGSGRRFVVEQEGRIRIVEDGDVLAEPFLDITDRVNSDGFEQGLLSMAFDPEFAESGLFYLGYTGKPQTNEVARFQVSKDDPNLADPDSEVTLLSIDDPFENHNGGLVMFGPDGYLYVGLGDGGAGGDPEGNGQDLGTLLGSILRLDVSGGTDSDDPPYAIPDDNPFVDDPDALPEIWAYGLRNPWRFSFDRETGDLWIADVGQNAWEEVDFQPADSPGGENYGWNIMEGAHCFLEDGCATDGLVMPIAEYGHDLGDSITGGYVYRGEAIPSLQGVYLFADFGSGRLWGLQRTEDGEAIVTEPIETGLAISSFGEDAAGELYLTAFDGTVYRIVAG